MKKILLALVLGTTATAAFADNTVELKYGNFSVTGPNVETGTVKLSGDKDAFSWGVELANADNDLTSTQTAEVTLGYAIGEFGGVAAVYDWAKTSGVEDDVLMLGYVGEFGFDKATVNVEMVTDIENVGDMNRLTVSGAYPINDRMTLTGESKNLWQASARDNYTLEVGAKYALTDTVFVDGALRTGEISGADVNGVILGLGMKF